MFSTLLNFRTFRTLAIVSLVFRVVYPSMFMLWHLESSDFSQFGFIIIQLKTLHPVRLFAIQMSFTDIHLSKILCWV